MCQNKTWSYTAVFLRYVIYLFRHHIETQHIMWHGSTMYSTWSCTVPGIAPSHAADYKAPVFPLVLWESYAVWLLRNLKLIDYLTLQPYAQSLPFNKSCVQKQFITACTVVCILSMVIQFSLIRTLSIMSLFICMEVQFK